MRPAVRAVVFQGLCCGILHMRTAACRVEERLLRVSLSTGLLSKDTQKSESDAVFRCFSV